ncbi:MAG TPA: response regulator transcription factor [Nakamurella sp.]|jgi:DNA-binding NarL/FixJ family response regulator
MIRVIVVDDEPIVRSGIALLLAGEPDIEVIADVDGEPGVVDLVRLRRPDVVIADVRMPVLDGVELTRRIVGDLHRTGNVAKVLVLTTFHVDEAVYAAIRAGASGFVLKDAAPTELVAAVRAVASGEAWLDPAVARQLIDEFAAHPPSELPGPAELQALTKREREVLVLMAHGLSNAEICDFLVVGEGTTKTHITRIFAKLGLRDRAQAVAMAYKSGLLRPDDPIPARRD